MEQIIPWKELCEAIEPYYPKPEGAGRRPVGIERMLRIHFLQHWFELSDPGTEEALYDSRAMRQFVGILLDLGREPVPDETTICKFRHLMERHNLGDANCSGRSMRYLEENGMKLDRGTIVDATIINAPSSTKNKDKQRDPEMHQTRKGKQWYFGMKAHIGVDSKTKMIHSVAATQPMCMTRRCWKICCMARRPRVWGDSAYTGQKAGAARACAERQEFHATQGQSSSRGYRRKSGRAIVASLECARKWNTSSMSCEVPIWFYQRCALSWTG